MSTETQERALYLEAARRLAAGEAVALATIVRAWGSTPREVGAKMLIDPAGSIRGTVGGGCGEAEVWQESRSLFADGRPRQVHVDLTEDQESDSAKVCGGRFDVFLELWQPDRLGSLAADLATTLASGADLALLTILGPTGESNWKRARQLGHPNEPVTHFADPCGRRLTVTAEGHMQGTVGDSEADTRLLNLALKALEIGALEVTSVVVAGVAYDVFVEALARAPSLVIAGAGHIARPLCAMAALCGYRVTVIDDRSEFARPEFFPSAQEVICRDFVEAFRDLATDLRTHVVLVTRGHRHDEDCLRQLVDRPLAYLGMIGSRRRTRAVFADLEREGVSPAWLDRIYAPIGLDIGAETPEEIALSILAEITKIHRGGKACSLTLRMGG